MDSLQNIKGRLGAVKNIGQITKAMEVVATTKMRTAQEVALGSRAYGFAALGILRELVLYGPADVLQTSPLFLARPVSKTLLLVMASDRGLAGAFNTAVARAVDQFLLSDAQSADHSYSMIVIGKKLFSYAAKKNVEVLETHEGFGDFSAPSEVAPLAKRVVEGFESGAWDRVIVISTHFRSTLAQETVVRELLPVGLETLEETVLEIVPERGKFSELRAAIESSEKEKLTEYIFEPSPAALLAAIVPHLIAMQIYQLVLEANASEHSARRVAMKSASDNASDLKGELTLQFNKARQAGITKEMTEIAGALNALE